MAELIVPARQVDLTQQLRRWNAIAPHECAPMGNGNYGLWLGGVNFEGSQQYFIDRQLAIIYSSVIACIEARKLLPYHLQVYRDIEGIHHVFTLIDIQIDAIDSNATTAALTAYLDYLSGPQD